MDCRTDLSPLPRYSLYDKFALSSHKDPSSKTQILGDASPRRSRGRRRKRRSKAGPLDVGLRGAMPTSRSGPGFGKGPPSGMVRPGLARMSLPRCWFRFPGWAGAEARRRRAIVSRRLPSLSPWDAGERHGGLVRLCASLGPLTQHKRLPAGFPQCPHLCLAADPHLDPQRRQEKSCAALGNDKRQQTDRQRQRQQQPHCRRGIPGSVPGNESRPSSFAPPPPQWGEDPGCYLLRRSESPPFLLRPQPFRIRYGCCKAWEEFRCL